MAAQQLQPEMMMVDFKREPIHNGNEIMDSCYKSCGKAYTMDDVAIRNIYIPQVLNNCSKREITKYFRQFGKVFRVKQMKIHNVSKNLTTNQICINFEKSESALRALECPVHKIKSDNFTIRPCISMHQPHAHSTIGNCLPSKKRATNRKLNSAFILQLNDDCLEMICQKLYLTDQITFGHVCQRFRNVFQMYAKIKYKKLWLHELFYLKTQELRDFFELCSTSIHHVKYGDGKTLCIDTFFNILVTYCHYIRRLDVTLIQGFDEVAKLIPWHNYPDLTQLSIINGDLTDNSIRVISKVRNLKFLDVSMSPGLQGGFLEDCTQVEVLNLSYCEKIQTHNLQKAIQRLTNLRVLDIRGCRRLYLDRFKTITECLLKVNMLIMECIPEWECITEIPNTRGMNLIERKMIRLERLKMMPSMINNISFDTYYRRWMFYSGRGDYADTTSALYQQLANSSRTELFDMHANPLVTDKEIAPSRKKFEKLKTTFIVDCSLISGDFMYKINNYLREKKKNPYESILVSSKTVENQQDLDNPDIRYLKIYKTKDEKQKANNDDEDDLFHKLYDTKAAAVV